MTDTDSLGQLDVQLVLTRDLKDSLLQGLPTHRNLTSFIEVNN